ncbi:MAG: hypothetical protein ACKO0M_13235 [Cyanobium sp.]
MPIRPALSALVLSGVVLAAAPLIPRAAGAAAPLRCAAPQPGRYAVMGHGQRAGEPVARLLLETWQADGSLHGLRLERRGSRYSETLYRGRYRALPSCRVAIQRSDGATPNPAQVVLDTAGLPRFSLGTQNDVVLISRWFRQPAGLCSASLLDGTVVSMQQGHSRQGGRWQANAVVQHERWSGGRVNGLAISSYGATIEQATYEGTIKVEPSCLATIRQRDSVGRPYNYRAIVLGDGSGYLYLQTDPDDLTVGWLERIRNR